MMCFSETLNGLDGLCGSNDHILVSFHDQYLYLSFAATADWMTTQTTRVGGGGGAHSFLALRMTIQ